MTRENFTNFSLLILSWLSQTSLAVSICGKWPRIDRKAKQPSVHYPEITARTEEMIEGPPQMRLKLASVLD